MPEKPYDHNQIELKWHERWNNVRPCTRPRISSRPEVLRARDAALSVRHAAHGPRAQLHDRRRAGALHVDERALTCSIRSAGMPSGCRRRTPPSSNKRHPRDWTFANIAHMSEQLRRYGVSYDWRREIATCEPEYYRWNQWFFLQMLERGLAYRKQSRVNWCPLCATVLANEQVVDGCCWRHEDTPVERARAGAVVSEDHGLRGRAAGRHEGSLSRLAGTRADHAAELDRAVAGHGGAIYAAGDRGEPLRSSRRASTRSSAATAVLWRRSIRWWRRSLLARQRRRKCDRRVEDRRASSVQARPGDVTRRRRAWIPAATRINPYNGETVPVWVANFVLMDYGTGAIMAVPAHDQRDFEFCTGTDCRFGR